MQAEGGSAHRDTRAVNGDDGALACQAHGPDRGGIRILENRAGLAAGDELSARRVAAVEKRFSYDLQTVLSRRLGDLARHSEDRPSRPDRSATAAASAAACAASVRTA